MATPEKQRTRYVVLGSAPGTDVWVEVGRAVGHTYRDATREVVGRTIPPDRAAGERAKGAVDAARRHDLLSETDGLDGHTFVAIPESYWRPETAIVSLTVDVDFRPAGEPH